MLGHRERFDRIEQQLAAGENVVLLANHQTEADPAVSPHDACWTLDSLRFRAQNLRRHLLSREMNTL